MVKFLLFRNTLFSHFFTFAKSLTVCQISVRRKWQAYALCTDASTRLKLTEDIDSAECPDLLLSFVNFCLALKTGSR